MADFFFKAVASHCHQWSVDIFLHWIVMLVLAHSKFLYLVNLTREHCFLLWILTASYFCLPHHLCFTLHPLWGWNLCHSVGKMALCSPSSSQYQLLTCTLPSALPRSKSHFYRFPQLWLENTWLWGARTAFVLNVYGHSITVYHFISHRHSHTMCPPQPDMLLPLLPHPPSHTAPLPWPHCPGVRDKLIT